MVSTKVGDRLGSPRVDSHFLYLSATPLHEPINGHGPFVMNSYAEILEAFDDIKTGNFINLRDKEFLSVQETAILLGASRWTIQRMIQREELKAGKLGRRTIIPRSEIDNLFN